MYIVIHAYIVNNVKIAMILQIVQIVNISFNQLVVDNPLKYIIVEIAFSVVTVITVLIANGVLAVDINQISNT